MRTSFTQSFQIYCLPQQQQQQRAEGHLQKMSHAIKRERRSSALNNSDNGARSGNWLQILQRCTFFLLHLNLFFSFLFSFFKGLILKSGAVSHTKVFFFFPKTAPVFITCQILSFCREQTLTTVETQLNFGFNTNKKGYEVQMWKLK